MRQLPPKEIQKVNRRPIFFAVIGVMTFCYITQFGFTLSPGARMGQGLFDHERPQAVQDMMDKRKKEQLGIQSSTDK